MPDHEFEKRVQDKMAELRVSPSAPVWDRVQEKLSKKEKNRRSLVWLPFLLAALFGSYYFIANTISQDKQVTAELNNKQQPKSIPQAERRIRMQIDENKVLPQDGVIIDPLSAVDTTAGLTTDAKMPKPPITKKAWVEETATSQSGSIGTTDVQIEETDVVEEKATRRLPAERSTVNPRNSQDETNRETLTADEKKILTQKVEMPQSGLLPANVKRSIVTRHLIDVFKQGGRPVLKIAERRQANRAKRNLQFGLSLAVGRSHINNGKFSNLLQNERVAENRLAYSTVGNNPGTVNSGSFYTPPARLKPGKAVSAGFYLKKQVSDNVRLSAGLNYVLHTTSNKSGKGSDTLLLSSPASGSSFDMTSTVYRTGNTITYTNKYHFVELPLLADGRLLNGRLPLYWNAGLSYSRLVASNALHYDSNYRLYFKNNKLLQKNQLNLHSGITAAVNSSAARPLLIGPEITYGLTNLLKAKNNPKHLLFIGLKASMPLKN